MAAIKRSKCSSIPSNAVQYVELEEDYQLIFNEAGLLTTPVMVRNLAVNPITMVVLVK